jgi:NAD(P)-dependent dehydrogenase (short-subunit alcohol dehydrogenase family)
MLRDKIVLVTAVSGGIGGAIFEDMAPGAKAIVSSSRRGRETFWKGSDWPGNATHVTGDMTKYAIKAMKRNGAGGGNIVHVVSISAKKIAINKSPYGIAKAGVAKLIHYAANEAAEYNILVNGISPGYVFTPRHEQEIDEKAKRTGKSRERVADGLISGQLVKQHLKPSDLLDVVRLLSTTRVMTGQVINVDLGEVLSY